MSYSSKGRKVRRRRKSINVRNLAILIAGAVVIIVLFVLLITGAVRLISKGIGALTGDGKEKNSSPSSSTVSDIDPSSQETSEPALVYSNIQMTQADEGQGELILVDATHGYQSEVEDLQIFWGNKNKSYQLLKAEMYAKPEVVTGMNEMMAAFQTQSGISSVMIYSAYRNADEQQQMYDNDLKANGTETSDTVAKAGYSEHHTGYALDLTYNSSAGTTYLDGSGSYSWLIENCYKYGFVIRYPEGKTSVTGMAYEPWHFRYIGKVHAEALTKGNYCLEEYLDMLKLHDEENPYNFVSETGADYLIYYIPSGGTTTEIPIPQGKEYTVSGTNEGGFVVTVTMGSGSSYASGTKVSAAGSLSSTSSSD